MANFSDIIFNHDPSLKLIIGTYDWSLVTLSVLIAIATATISLQLARVAQTQQSHLSKNGTIIAGAICLGAGIWSMHFIGMMALNICTKVNYSIAVTLFSMLPGILASWYALKLISAGHLNIVRLTVGGLLVGAGIGSMHYTGMLAMQMGPRMQFDMIWVLISVVVAVSLATLSLWVGLRFSRYGGVKSVLSLLAGGSIMGVAISAMHYTGMNASIFIGEPLANFNPAENHSTSFALGITLVTTLVTILALSINALIRYRKMLEEIRSSETRLAAILNTTKDSIFTLAPHGEIESYNAAALHMFDIEANKIRKYNFSQLVNVNNSHYNLANLCDKTADKNQMIEFDGATGIRSHGQHFPVKLNLGCVEVMGRRSIIAFITDLTQKKAFEEAVREKDLQLQSLMNNIPGVAFRIVDDAVNTPVLLSSSIEALTGWDASHYFEKEFSIRSHVIADHIDVINQQVQHSKNSKNSYHVEYRIRNKHGEERWVSELGSVQINPISGQSTIDGVMMDVTESKLKNAAFESIVQAIHRSTCIVEYTTEGFILNANQKFLDVMGFTLEEVIGKNHAIFCPKDFVKSAQYRQKWASLKNGHYVEGDYLRYGKDGKEVWIHASYNPLLDADGNVIKILLFMIDISERIQMEKALTEAKENAEMAADAKATFLANMSHEIRTPMNAVIGFSEILMDTPLNQEQQKFLSTIRTSAKSLLHLLNDILDSAKLEKGKFTFEELNFSLEALLDSVVSTLWVQARKKNLELELIIEPNVGGYYLGAEDRIRQVLMNLAGNAIKFTEQGKVKLHAKKSDGNFITISVQDTGIGIPQDRLSAIFEPFTQADASMSRRFGGTGLGTTISKQLVEAMGGSISATSTVGVGSCFTITLPLKLGTVQTQNNLPSDRKLPKLNILIADDIPQNRELLSILLRRDGHHIEMAENGLVVLEKFKNGGFDLAILDVQMPEMDGLTAAKKIREIEKLNHLPRTPLIALTASVLEEDRLAVKEADMDGFATKPIDIAALNNEISHVISGKSDFVYVEPAHEARLKIVDLASGEQRWGDPYIYQQELMKWADKQSELMREFEGLTKRADFFAIQSFAHACKGVAGNLSALALQDIYAALETRARENQHASVIALVQPLKNASAAFVDFVGQHMMKPQADAVMNSTNLLNAEELLKVIQELTNKANQGEIDDAKINHLVHGVNAVNKPIALKIEQAFNDFEFPKCEELLLKLKEAVLI
jgi:PAS domain S-box-containing protein